MARRPPLGQHFLRDERTMARIVSEADIAPGMHVLEIGPGPGNLTDLLAKAVGPAGKVTAIEADASLAGPLQGRWPNVAVVQGDALKINLGELGPFDRIVSNLPYQISGPITIRFLEMLGAAPWGKAVLMYQKEFAKRILAEAGSKAYGRLSVHVARYCQTQSVKEVPPGAFNPPPKVRSLVISLTPHDEPPFVVDDALWHRVVDGAFGQRRKQLRNTLPEALFGTNLSGKIIPLLEGMALDKQRPESLAPETFAAIVAALEQA